MQEDKETVTGKHADAEDHVVADEDIQDLDNGEKDLRVGGVLRGKYMIAGITCAGCGTFVHRCLGEELGMDKGEVSRDSSGRSVVEKTYCNYRYQHEALFDLPDSVSSRLYGREVLLILPPWPDISIHPRRFYG
jgi:hypothetical protein